MADTAQHKIFGPFFEGGALVNSPRLYHYEPGTTTLKVAYTARDKSAEATQPIQGDSQGVIDGYFDGLYKIVIKTSDDATTLYTWDHVGPDYAEGTWTPALTFSIPGDLTVAYGARYGTFTKMGRLVHVTFFLNATTFTHTTASSLLNITGLPYAARELTNGEWIGPLSMQGYTKANYTQLAACVLTGGSLLSVKATGSGQNYDNLTVSDVPTGSQKILFGSLWYEAAS